MGEDGRLLLDLPRLGHTMAVDGRGLGTGLITTSLLLFQDITCGLSTYELLLNQFFG